MGSWSRVKASGLEEVELPDVVTCGFVSAWGRHFCAVVKFPPRRHVSPWTRLRCFVVVMTPLVPPPIS